MTDISENNKLIEVKDLTKSFGKRIVLDGISLAIEKGKTTVVIGPSGCGKTVFLKHLIGLFHPTSGEVYFKGERIDEMRDNELNKVRMHFGYLFQGGALFDSMTVFENITFPITQNHKVKDWRFVEELVKEKLAMVGMDGYQNAYPANLSGGQKKRVALARAIALNPEVVLYDEPTTGLDPIRSDIINELILKLEKELGITSVVVTHDMKSAYKVGDRIIMLHEGRIIADGNDDYIKQHPNHIVQAFINGELSGKDLEALRHGGTKFMSQYLPQDFIE